MGRRLSRVEKLEERTLEPHFYVHPSGLGSRAVGLPCGRDGCGQPWDAEIHLAPPLPPPPDLPGPLPSA